MLGFDPALQSKLHHSAAVTAASANNRFLKQLLTACLGTFIVSFYYNSKGLHKVVHRFEKIDEDIHENCNQI